MRSNNVDCDAALIVTSCGDEQSNNSITINDDVKISIEISALAPR